MANFPTEDNDSLTGAAGNDTIDGLAGNDTIDGDAGNDTLYGGSGNDSLIGGAGDDHLYGGSGLDRLYGDSGNDRFYINANDVGNDYLYGGDGTDWIYVTADLTVNRFLLNSTYLNSVEGLYLYPGSVNGTTGNDVFDISGVTTVSSAGSSDFFLNDGNDSFVGHIGQDTVYGGSGNDTLYGGAGDDSLDGGDGSDTLSYRSASGGVTVDLSITDYQAVNGGQGSDKIANFEHVRGSKGNDRLTGSDKSNTLSGENGNDVLRGGRGNDVLNGGSGFDVASFSDSTGGIRVNLAATGSQRISSSLGDDRLISIEGAIGSRQNDRMNGSNGANQLRGEGGNDTLIGGAGADTLDGGAGSDWTNYTGNGAVRVDLGRSSAQSTAHGTDKLISVENVSTGNGNDRLAGSGAANEFLGNGGSDTLLGAGGNDLLNGGAGNDLIDGGAGRDTIVFTGNAAAKVNLSLTGGQNTGYGTDKIVRVENVTGGNGNDALSGNGAANVLSGRGGNDRLLGGGGNDSLDGGTGNDTLEGGAGTDRIVFDTNANIRVSLATTALQTTGAGRDKIIGVEQIQTGGGDDRLTGNAGKNLLIAGAGDDRLTGGSGSDILTGGAGEDVFVFARRQGSDRITDFEDGIDTIHISGARFAGLTIEYAGNDTKVSFGGTTILVKDVYYIYLDETDFTFG